MNEPCPSIPRWIATVAIAPTSGSLSRAWSYRSPIVGRISEPGPRVHGSVSVSPIRKWCATMPWWWLNAPVPIVAWICAVLGGDDPTSAFSYHAPCGISDRRYGQSSGHALSTSRPAPSHTTVTTSFGGAASGSRASCKTCPSGASNGKPISSPVVGAMSASVTRRSISPAARMCPGPYQSSGTSEM